MLIAQSSRNTSAWVRIIDAGAGGLVGGAILGAIFGISKFLSRKKD